MTNKIKFCYFGSELPTHSSANQPLIKELRKRGHKVKIIRWKFSDNVGKVAATIPDVDIVLGETGLPKRNEQNKDQIWVCVIHGISMFKHNYIATHAGRFDMWLIPTEDWIGTRKISCKPELADQLIYPTGGWSKYDLYYKYLKERKMEYL